MRLIVFLVQKLGSTNVNPSFRQFTT